MRRFYKIIFLFTLITSGFILNAKNTSYVNNLALPTATISGTTVVCQNTARPQITFTGSGGTAPYTFTYTTTGAIGNQTIATTSGNSITLSVPTTIAGTFNYTLISVHDSANPNPEQSSPGIATVTVSSPPVIDFTFLDNQCSGASVQFTTTSIGNSYTWNFGDGATSSNKNPTHTFTSLGCGTKTFNVTLTITDSNGCSGSITKTITINEQPNINFEDVNATSAGNQFNNCTSASISNTSYTITVGNISTSTCITSDSINWGDGITENNVIFPKTHTYPQLGAYNMVVTALGNNLCSNSKIYVVKNISNPSGGILNPGGTTDMCIPTPIIQYTIGNWATNSPGTTYAVDYGDGSAILNLNQDDMIKTSYYNSITPSSSVNYPVPYSYNTNSCPNPEFTIKLIVTNACKSTTGTVIGGNTISKPKANFTAPQNACLTDNVLFANTTTLGYDTGCIIDTKFSWNFGDPASGAANTIDTGWLTNKPNVNHTFSSIGTYTVTLSTKNGCGTTTKTQQICIEAPLVPVFALNYTGNCTPLPVKTTNATNHNSSCTTPTYQWNVTYSATNCGTTSNYTILNGATLTSFAPEFNFINSGTYSISLTTTSTVCGSVTSPIQTVIVKQPPTIAITAIPTICQLGSSTSINPTATVPACANATYAWSFPGGTPATSTATNPSVSYSSSGTFNYSLTVTNECGSTTATSSFTINPSPTITGTLFSCVGATSQLIGSLAAAITSPWTSSVPAIASVNNTGLVTGVSAGTTTITYTDSNGCKTTALFTINPLPKITGNLGICLGSTTSLSGSATAATSNPWLSSNTSVATIDSTGLVTSLSVGTTTITYTNTNGCQKTATVTVNPLPTITGTITVCVGSTTSLTSSLTAAASNSWSSSNPSVATVSTTGVVTGVSSGTTIITYTNSNGCQNIVTVTVNPKPVIPAQTASICSGSTFTVTPINGPGTVVPLNTTYTWIVATNTNVTGQSGSSVAGVSNISQTLTNLTNVVQTVAYTVTPTSGDTGNCAGVPFAITVTVNPKPVIANQTVAACSGTAFTLPLTNSPPLLILPTGTTYTWIVIPPSGIAGASNQTTGVSAVSQTLTNSTNASINVIYTVIASSGTSPNNCTTSFVATVTINPTPIISNATATICSNTSFSVTPTNGGGTNSNDMVPTGTTYSWQIPVSIPAGAVTGGSAATNVSAPLSQTLVSTSSSPATLTYTITPKSGNCLGTTFTIVVTVQSNIGNSSINIAKCSGDAIGLSLGGNSSITYQITSISSNGMISSAGNPTTGTNFLSNEIADDSWINTTASTVNVVYTIVPNGNNGCSGQPFTVTVAVNPKPVVGNQTAAFCSDSPFGISLNSSTGASATTYNITAINSNGLTASAGNPAIGTGLLSNVIADDAWTNTTPAAVNVVYTVVPVSAEGCAGNPFTVTVTINPEPLVVNQTDTICSDIANGIILGNDIDTPLVVSYNITNINKGVLTAFGGNPITGTGFSANEIADDAWTNTTPSTVNVIYTVVPVSASGCTGNPFTVTVTVESTLGVGPKTATTCSDVANGFILGTAANTTYTITNINSNGLTSISGNQVTGTGFLSNEIANDIWNNSSASAINVIYTVEPVSSNGCSGQPFTVTITVNPEPIVANQTHTICSDSPFGISLNSSSSVSATIYNITAINSNGLTASAGNPVTGTGLLSNVIADDAWTNTTPATVNVVYTVFPISAEGCAGKPLTVTVTVNPEPVVVNQTVTICSDIANGIILGNDIDTPSVVSYNITNIDKGALTAFAGNPIKGTGFSANEIVDDAWTNTTPSTVNVIYTVVPVSASGCMGNPFTVTVTVESTLGVGPQTTTTCSDVAHGFILGTAANTTYTITNINPNGLNSIAGNPATGTGFGANEIADDVWNNITASPINVIYTVEPVSSNGCSGQPFTVTVIINPEPIVVNQTHTTCSDSPFGISLNSSTGAPAANYNITAINSNGLIASAGNPATGTGFTANVMADDAWTNTTSSAVDVVYSVIPVSAAGCAGNPFTVTVTVNPEPVVVNQTGTICSDIANGIILGNDIDTPLAVSYNITNINTGGLVASAGNPQIGTGFSANEIADDAWTNITPAAVNVIYTVVPVSASGCMGNPFTVTVTVESTLGVGPQTTTTCSDVAHGFILGTTANTTYTITNINPNGLTSISGNPATGTGFGANEIADDVWNNITFSPINVIYTVEPVSSNGCSGQPFTVTVTINPEPIVANQTHTTCSDSPFGISLNSSTGAPAANYNITAINSNGLIASAGNPATGTGFTANVMADDAWTNTTSSAVDVVYSVIPVSVAGCAGNPFTVIVTVNPEPVVVNQTGTICSDIANGIILGNDIDTPLAVSYNITNINTGGLVASAGNPQIGTGFSANEIADDVWTNITPAAVNVIYTVVPVSASGCMGNPFTVTVTVESELAIADQLTTVCSEAVNGIVLGTEPTATYTITSIVSNGLTASEGNPQVGTGFLANVIADDAWTNLGNIAVPIVYHIIPQSSSGCSGNPFTITVTINPEPIVTGQGLTVCSDEPTNVILGDDVDGPSATTYSITNINSNGLFSFSGNPKVGNGFSANEIVNDAWTNTTLLTVPVIYEIIPVSATGCQGNPFTISINVNPQINIAVAITPIRCYGANDASISLTVTGGTAPYQAQWNNLATGFNQNNLSANTYVIVVTDSKGCTKSVTVNIPEAPIFTVNPVVKNISCFGVNDGSITLNFVGGIAPVTLTWNDGAVTGTTRNNLKPGTYTVTITDGKPCTIKRTFIILEPQLLVLQGNVTNAFDCSNANSGAINLLVSGGSAPFTYSWSNGATTEDLANIPAGNYLVTVKDINGCSIQAQYSINRPPPIVTSVETKTDFNCDTKTVQQTFVAQISGGVPPYQLKWSSGTVSGPNNEFMNTSQNGTVILNATDAIGCKSNYTFTVDIPTLGTPSFNSSSFANSTFGTYSINDPIQFTNTATGDYISMIWDFGDGSVSSDLNPVHTYIIPKEYVVTQTVTYPFGCVSVQKITFMVEKGYVLVVPTAFTPNNDSLNDTFRPVTKGLKKVRLDIYDTWGSMIYSESGDVIKGWDGKIKGNNSENGNYYCKVSGETFYGIIINENTPFVLLK